MERILKVNAPSVVAEIIDGEAVIMNLASGHYFSTQHVGCDVWHGIELEKSRSAIVRALRATYDVDEADATRAVDAFVQELIDRQLVIETDATRVPLPNGNGVLASPDGARPAFIAPQLHAYTDMEELLLLDPIHDVDEMGWPMPKAAEEAR